MNRFSSPPQRTEMIWFALLKNELSLDNGIDFVDFQINKLSQQN